REKDPQSVYVGNLGGGIDTVKDIKELSHAAAWFNADHQGRSGETPIWNCAQQGRVAQSVMQGRTITNVGGLQQCTTKLAARFQSACRTDALACANYCKRDGAMVSLAGRFSRGQ